MSLRIHLDFLGIVGEKVHFYGNDGVCAFKYLVTTDDPQRWFSFSVSLVNLVCGIIISISYIFIYARTTESTKDVQSRSNANKVSIR